MEAAKNKQPPKGCQIGCGATMLLFIMAVIIGSCMDLNRNHSLKKESDPSEIAKLIIDYDDKDAASSTEQRGDVVDITFNADPWGLTEGMVIDKFYLFTRRLTPTIFQNVPDCKTVILRATATMSDVRGNNSRAEILAVRFSRTNSEVTNWDNILLENIPMIADYFYAHPSLNIGF